jgi:hypothetical protein
MYFLQQIKRQFFLCIAIYGGPEWQWEAVVPTTPEWETPPVTSGEVADKARTVNDTIDNAVTTEENRGLVDTPVSPETQAFIDTTETPEGRDLSSPEAVAAYNELWLEQTQATINTDAFTEWETPEEYVESTTEELEGSLNEIDVARQNVARELEQTAPGSPERVALEQRQSFLSWLFSTVEGIMNGTEISWDGALGVAQKYMGIHEDSWEADQFLMWMAQSARTTPWCAGFVSAVCKEAGYENVTPTLSSRALIGQTGKWHVAFNVWNGQMLGWNQSNKVSVTPIKKEVEGWVMPEHAGNPDKTYTRENNNVPSGMTGKDVFDSANIPVWAIIVFKRNESQGNEK